MPPPDSDASATGTARHVMVVADGDVAPRGELDVAWPGWSDGVVAVVAADGGLARARTLALRVDAVVGDLDSVPPAEIEAAAADGIEVLRADVDKDESDTELALLEAVRLGATRITVLGAFGGPRLDHALANVWLLAHPALAGRDVTLLDARWRMSLVAAPDADGGPVDRALPGPVGSLVSLLPHGGDVTGITTRGLRYPLLDEPLVVGPARGLSNVRILPDARVRVGAGRLLIVETAPG